MAKLVFVSNGGGGAILLVVHDTVVFWYEIRKKCSASYLKRPSIKDVGIF